MFVPSTWSIRTTQPLRVTRELEPVKVFHGEVPIKTPAAADLDAMVARIQELRPAIAAKSGSSPPPPDYLLLLYPERFLGALPRGAEKIAGNADFLLMRLP